MSEPMSLPYLCLRSLVLFPGQSVDLAVGRAESQAVINAIHSRDDGRLIAVTQRRGEQTADIAAADLYSVGVLCTFGAKVKLGDCQRVHVTALHRVRLAEFRHENGIQMVSATSLKEPHPALSEWKAERDEILGAMRPVLVEGSESMRELFEGLQRETSLPLFLSGALELLRQRKRQILGIPTEKFVPFPEDPQMQQLVNTIIAEQQLVLEELDPRKQLEAMADLCRALQNGQP